MAVLATASFSPARVLGPQQVHCKRQIACSATSRSSAAGRREPQAAGGRAGAAAPAEALPGAAAGVTLQPEADFDFLGAAAAINDFYHDNPPAR